MELSAEILHSTVNSIKPFAGERRQYERVPFRFKVKIIPYQNKICSDPITLWTRDVSPGGIGLVYHKPMRTGFTFIIRLPRQDEKPALLLCTVRSCATLAANVYGIGASFTEVAESKLAPEPTRRSDPIIPVPLIAKTLNASELTDEVRRISEAILA